jgi:hypothetical protein
MADAQKISRTIEDDVISRRPVDLSVSPVSSWACPALP